MSKIISLTVLIYISQVKTNNLESNDNNNLNEKNPSDPTLLLYEQMIDVNDLKNVQLFSPFQSSTNKYNTKVNCEYNSHVPACVDQRNMMFHRYPIPRVTSTTTTTTTSQISRDNILQSIANFFPQLTLFKARPMSSFYNSNRNFPTTENPLWFQKVMMTKQSVSRTIKKSRPTKIPWTKNKLKVEKNELKSFKTTKSRRNRIKKLTKATNSRISQTSGKDITNLANNSQDNEMLSQASYWIVRKTRRNEQRKMERNKNFNRKRNNDNIDDIIGNDNIEDELMREY